MYYEVSTRNITFFHEVNTDGNFSEVNAEPQLVEISPKIFSEVNAQSQIFEILRKFFMR